VRTEEDIMKKLAAITKRRKYWSNQLDKIGNESPAGQVAFHNHRFWAAQEAALKYVVGLQDSLTIQH
jgi:hypothetical protein